MFILVSGATATVEKLMNHHPNLGVLMCPRGRHYPPERGIVWAADNSAFAGFDEAMFLQMLKKIEGRDDCEFVSAPDVVGDHEETLRLWPSWSKTIRSFGLRPSFVCQDGCLPEDVPWEDTSGVFIGGTTRYKLSEAAAAIITAANRRNLWTHIGRVNTARRMVYAAAIGARSVDGSSFSRFSQTHLPWALRIARNHVLRLHI